MAYELHAVPKPSGKKKQKTAQSRMGDIGDQADAELKDRSGGICELCEKAEAMERAHLTGRPHMDENTAAKDLMHLCVPCHRWLDQTPEGIRCKRHMARAINKVVDYEKQKLQGIRGG